jgi:serine/threonine-protein kinase
MPADLRERLQSTLGNDYAIDSELGGGGMSRVFLAQESALGRPVVVKVLPPELVSAINVERFRREIQLAAQLQHPHIVPLLSAAESGGLLFYTMPRVNGESLRARLDRSGELPIPEAVRLLRELADALAYAHRHGVVHRDVKPENVLCADGHALITDFGVAKALSLSSGVGSTTSPGLAIGTPTYMSPEQAAGDPQVDGRADVYSFGAVAYEVLSGRPPFQRANVQALLAAHIAEAPDPVEKLRPAIPPALAALVTQCLEKRPADRPQGAAEILRALDALGTNGSGSPGVAVVPVRSGVSRRWLLVAGLLLALLVVLLVAYAYRERAASFDTPARSRYSTEARRFPRLDGPRDEVLRTRTTV